MANRVIVFVSILVLLFAGSVGLVSQDTQSVRAGGDETHVTDEAWNVDPGNVTTLNNSNQPWAYSPQSNVTVTQDSTEFEPEGNWTWHEHNGTIQAVEGTQLNDSKDAFVDYSYYQPTDEQATVRGISSLFVTLGPEALLLAAIILLMGAVAVAVRAGGM